MLRLNASLLSPPLLLAGLLAALGSAHRAPAQDRYTLTVLDPGTGQPRGLGKGINDRGDVTLQTFTANGVDDQGFMRLSTGQYVPLPAVAGFSSSLPTGLNNRRVATGGSINQIQPANPGAGTLTAWNAGGVAMDLGNLGFTFAYGVAINNANTVVGRAGVDLFSSESVPIKWQGGVISQLTHPSYTEGEATSINNRGVVVGTLWNSGYTDAVGFITDRRGDPQPIGLLPGGSYTGLFGINESGVAVGWGDSAEASAQGVFETAIVYKNGRFVSIMPPPGYQIAELLRIKNSGTAIGVIVDVSQNPADVVWVVMANSQLYRLTDQVIQPSTTSSWVIVEARDINNRGQIVGTAVDTLSAAPAPVPVLLDPVHD